MAGNKFVRHELWQQEQIRALIDNSSLSEQEVLEGLSRGEQYSFNLNGNVLEEVESICERNNIELILTTIPSCPYWNNDYKNELVKKSQYRYIDFAKAVGAYDSLTWNDGLLEKAEKRIHPTEAGARALYSEAITIVPELLTRNR